MKLFALLKPLTSLRVWSTTLAILWTFQASAQGLPPGQKLSDASYLRKLSLTIKGTPPSAEEYAALSKIKDSSQSQAFFEAKVSEYMKHPAYRDRMVFRLNELFQTRTPEAPRHLVEGGKVAPMLGVSKPESLTHLFAKIVTDNLSWDQLLLAKEYTAEPSSYSYAASQMLPSDFGFLSLVDPTLPLDQVGALRPAQITNGSQKPTTSRQVKFNESDIRIAGALTTARFSSRYNTTAVNKNRRRAAAVFRIFLCDPMNPVIPAGGDKHYEYVEATFPENYEVTEDMIRNRLSSDAKHGTDKDCMACHYKLDPLGKVFRNIGVTLGPEPAPGALIFKRPRTGDLVDKPVKGIGELAKAIVEQPEYTSCQVKWFWKQFIGKDVRLNGAKLDQWVNTFNSNDRRANDFVRALVLSDEFRTKPAMTLPPEIVTFDQVEHLLERCDSCHAEMGTIPIFTSLPIGMSGTQKEHDEWIATMLERLSLPKGHRKKMPKESAGWKQSDIDQVLNWLKQGARDASGKPTVTGAAQ